MGKIPRPKATKASKLHAQTARTRMVEKEKERQAKLDEAEQEGRMGTNVLDEEPMEVPKEDLFKMKRFRDVPPRINTHLKKSPAKSKTEEQIAQQAVAVPESAPAP